MCETDFSGTPGERSDTQRYRVIRQTPVSPFELPDLAVRTITMNGDQMPRNGRPKDPDPHHGRWTAGSPVGVHPLPISSLPRASTSIYLKPLPDSKQVTRLSLMLGEPPRLVDWTPHAAKCRPMESSMHVRWHKVPEPVKTN